MAAKTFKVVIEVEVEVISESVDVAASFTSLLTLPKIRKIQGVKKAKILEIRFKLLWAFTGHHFTS